MGGRGTGSGFRAGGAASPQVRAKADELLSGLLGGASAATPEAAADAQRIAQAWQAAERAIKTQAFTDEGFGQWTFDTGGPADIGAQILEEQDGITGDRMYSMRTWTYADQGVPRYFVTRAAAQREARDEMQKRLVWWARSQPLG